MSGPPVEETAAPTPPSPSSAPATWTSLGPDAGPAAREDHTWTYDPDTRAAWLFGGRDGSTEFADLWRFDLDADAWQQIAPGNAGPAARFGHTGTWIDGVGLVVWSGQAGTTFFDDLWAFDPNDGDWRELPTGDLRPAARYGSCAALGPDARLWVSHGFTADNGRFADTWAYDMRDSTWIESTPDGDLPPIRCLHDCLWAPDGRLILYAGQTTGVPAIGDLWTRTVDGGWVEALSVAPPARQLYGLASLGDRAWVHGGGAADGSKLGDLWELDLSTLAWTERATSGDQPSGRTGAALVADPETGRLLLFGGLTDDGASDEVWELSPVG